MRLVFDIEADNLYRHATKIHCICVEDIDTGEHWAYGPDELEQALKNMSRMLSSGEHSVGDSSSSGGVSSQAPLLVAHNGCGYDIPVLKKLLGWTPPKGVEIRDTMVWGSLCFSNLKELDFASNDPEIRGLSGSQSLEAWGKRLGEHKQDYQGGFEHFTPEMLEYCSQDVKATKTLFKHLEKQHYSLEALKLEQRIHYEYSMMEYRGIAFDKEAAENLAERLQNELQRLQTEINGYVPPLKIEKTTPQFWSIQWPDESSDTFLTKGEAEAERKRRKIRPRDVVLTRGPNKFEIKEFNPGSSKQVRDYFVEKYGWISPKLTDTGQEKFKKKEGTYEDLAKEYGSTEEDILRTLEWPEAEIIADYGMVSKVYSMTVSGDSAWLQQVQSDGRIRPRTKGIGAVTHRSSCVTPNLQQTPSVVLDTNKQVVWGFDGRFGADCRALFLPSEGKILIGTDLSGIEACMLAHFLHAYDGGAYTDQVLNGDIHQLNVEAFQKHAQYTIARNPSKTLFYAWSYGSGDEKLGRICVDICEEGKQEFKDQLRLNRLRMDEQKANFLAYKYVGKKIRHSFEQGITCLDKLITTVKHQASRGYLKPLDGRRIPVRKEHAALNTLLQGSAAIVMKRWVVLLQNQCLRHIPSASLLAVIHDEVQMEVAPEDSERYADTAIQTIKQAGEFYNLNIALSGEAKTGKNWAETH